MSSLALHASHVRLGATFAAADDVEWVAHYGNFGAEYDALRTHVGVTDLDFRSRICLTGQDRVRLLHGQVTNDIQRLAPGQGCFAAVVSAKGKIEADLNVYALPNELLLDFEPGLTARLTARFERYTVADDVQIVDAAPYYGLLTVQGPLAGPTVLGASHGFNPLPGEPFAVRQFADPDFGDVYVARRPRADWPLDAGAIPGFDLYAPLESLPVLLDRLLDSARAQGGRPVGLDALEACRIEAGIPRFGVDLDETNLAPEAGERFVQHAIHYAKGCYIGQEVIARLRTYGQVARALRGLRLDPNSPSLPARGDRLYHSGKDVGYVTSSLRSPRLGHPVALAFVRRECNQPGTALQLRTGMAESTVEVVSLPFARPS